MAERKNRTDGWETKQKILEHAGQLFALRGYHNTSAKDICKSAGVNAAAINYHFQGKDGLYEQIMAQAIEHFLHKDFVESLDTRNASAEEKLDALIHHMVKNILEPRSWHAKVWAREIVTPSPVIEVVLAKEAHTRASIIKKVVIEACGKTYDPKDIESTYALFTLLAPCMMLMIVNPNLPTPVQPIFSRSEDELAAYMKSLVMNQYGGG